MFVYKFELEDENGAKVEHTIALKPFDQLPNGVLRKNRDNPEAGVWAMFEWGLSPNDLELFDQAPASLTADLLEAWQKASNVDAGKIIALIDLIDEHGDALAADLLDAGMRLRDFPSERHSWYDLHVFVKYLDRESKLFREMYPDKADWTLGNRLLAMVVNCLRLLLWAKTKDGQKGRKRPQMIGPDWSDKTPKRPGSNIKAHTPISQIKKPVTSGENLGRKLVNLFR
ncbi:tail assembly chaperone [Mycobacterium phage Nebkiss]|nr:tail assembly chaperone [Mycobacterium phage Nebkiss]